MGSATHRIQRQIFELRAPEIGLAQRVQDEVSRIQPRRVLPILDHVCSDLIPPKVLYRLGRVDVDLGVIPASTLERTLCEKLEHALRSAISAHIEEVDEGGRAFRQDARKSSAVELFVHFAKNGNLPWWADAKEPRLLEQTARFLLDEAREWLPEVLSEVSRDPLALRRITLAYDNAILSELCAVFVRPPEARALCALPPALVQLVKAGKLRADHPLVSLRSIAWACALHAAIRSRRGSSSAISEEALVEMAVATRIPHREMLLAGIVESAIARAKAAPDADPDADPDAAPDTDIEPHLYSTPGKDPDATPDPEPELASGTEATSELCNLSRPLRSSRPRAPAGRSGARKPVAGSRKTSSILDIASIAAEPDELYVHDAGLCIFWPFLPTFFEQLGLLEERRFRDEPSRQRAVWLLSHLATGELESQEIFLPLPKILCGVSPNGLVEPSDPLTEPEIALAAELIAATIANAAVLNDMSATFFRHSFLLRDGVLSSQDGAFLLHVARETYDIVLEQLPWAFDWIMLPFMDAPLRVEWR